MDSNNQYKISDHMSWWNNLTIEEREEKLEASTFIVGFDKRHWNMLTSREIKSIYDSLHPTADQLFEAVKNQSLRGPGLHNKDLKTAPKCMHCGADKVIESGLCTKCGRFPTQKTDILKAHFEQDDK